MPWNNNIFVGDCAATYNDAFLEYAGIEFILNCAGNIRNPTYSRATIIQLDLYDPETYRLSDKFHVSMSFINKALLVGGRVLVNCYAGFVRYLFDIFSLKFVLMSFTGPCLCALLTAC